MDAANIPGIQEGEEKKPIETKSLTVKEVQEQFGGHEVIPENEFEELVEDCKCIITESVTNVRQSVIECKWEIGNRLFESGEERIRPYLNRLAIEIHLGERDLYHCLAFRRKYPDLKQMWNDLPEGKNISWHKLINNYVDFEMPKPVMPVEEKFDEWGITDWWQKQKSLTCLRIKSKQGSFTLVVRTARVKKEEESVRKGTLNDQYKEISEYYIKLKKWDVKDLDRADYGRMYKAIKVMLEKAKYDKSKVLRAIKWCHDKYLGSQIDWTMETVLKKYPEACRPVNPMEKYMKKPDQKYFKR